VSTIIILVRPVVDIIKTTSDARYLFRKIHTDYYPENNNHVKQTGNFRLSLPKISTCNTMLEEDVSLCSDPEKKIGISQTQLKDCEKLWVNNSQRDNNTLIMSIVNDKNRPPKIFVFQ